MTDSPQAAPKVPRRRVIIALSRAFASVAVLLALYYVWPFEFLRVVPFWLSMTIAGILLVGISLFQIRSIAGSRYPALRATEALAITAPLFLLLFAACYLMMVMENPANFSEAGLTRTDMLYFTITTFATVGFGDITAVSESARVAVTVQMVLNLLVLGAGIRVFIGAVQKGRASLGEARDPQD